MIANPNDYIGKKILDRIRKIRAKNRSFSVAFDHENAHRTSNMVVRLMNYQDRLLFAQQYFHGTAKSARFMVRAQALIWNFHPYSLRTRRRDPNRISPFQDINGFSYHENWLQNLLIAASMGGRKLRE